MLVGGFNPSEKYESDGIIIPTIWDIPTIGENNSHVPTINQLWILIHFTSTFSWENYNISLTWIKAIWGWFPLLTMIPRARSQWGRDEIYPEI